MSMLILALLVVALIIALLVCFGAVGERPLLGIAVILVIVAIFLMNNSLHV